MKLKTKLLFLYEFLKKGEGMEVIFARIAVALIIKGKKKFYEIEPTLKELVRKLLIDLELEHLIIEEEPKE